MSGQLRNWVAHASFHTMHLSWTRRVIIPRVVRIYGRNVRAKRLPAWRVDYDLRPVDSVALLSQMMVI